MEPSVVFFNQKDWKDIQPLSAYRGGGMVGNDIPHFGYTIATNYFRAVVNAGEQSARVLSLAEYILRRNPCHYPAWKYRYKALRSLNHPLDAEVAFVNEVLRKSLKAYQPWAHRKDLLMQTGNWKDELPLLESLLHLGENNYQTWSYRQWLLSSFAVDIEVLDGELRLIDKMMAKNTRNNSCWHHRFFIVWILGQEHRTQLEDLEVLDREITYTKGKISLDPNNSSAWNYLRGVLDHKAVPLDEIIQYLESYAQAVDQLSHEDAPRARHTPPIPVAVELLADLLYDARWKEGNASEVIKLWKLLAEDCDVVHARYWVTRIRDALSGLGPK